MNLDFTVIYANSRNGIRDIISNPLVITGYVSVAGVGQVPFEGPLERDFLIWKDFGRRMSDALPQPLRIEFEEDGPRRYTPDYLCTFRPFPDGRSASPILFEIKPRDELKKNWSDLRPGFRRAMELCRQRGWRFRIATERLIRPKLEAIHFLRGYLEYPENPGIAEVLCSTLETLGPTTPADLLATAFGDSGERLAATGVLWKLAVSGKIGIDLGTQLNMATPIWAGVRDDT